MLVKKYIETIPVKPLSKALEKEDNALAVHIDESEKHGKILVIEAYTNGALSFRTFLDGNTWVNLQVESGEWNTRTPFSDYGFHPFHPWADSGDIDRKMVYDFFYPCPEKIYKWAMPSVADSVQGFVSIKRSESRRAAADVRRARMEAHLALLPKELSFEIKKYVKDIVFENRYILMSKGDGKSKVKFKCLHCSGRAFFKEKALRHRSKLDCPRCKSSCIVIAERYIDATKDSARMLIFYNAEGVVLKDYLKVYRFYSKNSKSGKILEFIGADSDVYARVEVISDGKVYSYKYNSMYWVGWRQSKTMDTCSRFVYADNLDAIFPGGIQEGLNLKRLRYAGAVNLGKLIDSAKNRADITPLLYKIGLYSLAESARYLNKGTTFENVLGVSSNYKQLLRKYNVTYGELEIIKLADCHVNEDMFLKIRRIASSGFTDGFTDICKHMSFTKMVNYFYRQLEITGRKDVSTLFTWYIDYLDMAKELNRRFPDDRQIDTSSLNFRFPGNLKMAHDNISGQLTVEKNEEKNSHIKAIKSEIEKDFAFSYDGMVLVIPESASDFIVEGRELRHCVGSGSHYIDAHIKREKMTFFIREKESPEKPFYTFSVNMKNLKVTECHGKCHKAATGRIKKFYEKFILKIKDIKGQNAA